MIHAPRDCFFKFWLPGLLYCTNISQQLLTEKNGIIIRNRYYPKEDSYKKIAYQPPRSWFFGRPHVSICQTADHQSLRVPLLSIWLWRDVKRQLYNGTKLFVGLVFDFVSKLYEYLFLQNLSQLGIGENVEFRIILRQVQEEKLRSGFNSSSSIISFLCFNLSIN